MAPPQTLRLSRSPSVDGSHGEHEEDSEHEEHVDDYEEHADGAGDDNLTLRPSCAQRKKERNFGILKARINARENFRILKALSEQAVVSDGEDEDMDLRSSLDDLFADLLYMLHHLTAGLEPDWKATPELAADVIEYIDTSEAPRCDPPIALPLTSTPSLETITFLVPILTWNPAK